MNRSFKNTLTGSLMLLLASFFWGSTFVAQSGASKLLSPFTYLFARSFVGAAAILAVIGIRALIVRRGAKDAQKSKSAPLFTKKAVLAGIFCGTALAVASALQQYGIHLGAGAGEAGFLTSVYMFIVPLLDFLFYRKKVHLNVLLGAVLAAAGLYFLCLRGQESTGFGIGHCILFCCAIAYAVHILIIDRYEEVDPLVLSFLQFTVCGIISLAVSLLFETPDPRSIGAAWFPILYAGIFSSAIAYTLQIYAQKRTPPALASVVMSTESVIALLSEWLCALTGIFGSPFSLSTDQIIGCLLCFAGIVLAQLIFKKKKKA